MIIFSFDILFNFFVEYEYTAHEQHTSQKATERNILMIGWLYLKGSLVLDLITIIPFFKLYNNLRFAQMFFFLKSLRYIKGAKMMSADVYTK